MHLIHIVLVFIVAGTALLPAEDRPVQPLAVHADTPGFSGYNGVTIGQRYYWSDRDNAVWSSDGSPSGTRQVYTHHEYISERLGVMGDRLLISSASGLTAWHPELGSSALPYMPQTMWYARPLGAVGDAALLQAGRYVDLDLDGDIAENEKFSGLAGITMANQWWIPLGPVDQSYYVAAVDVIGTTALAVVRTEETGQLRVLRIRNADQAMPQVETLWTGTGDLGDMPSKVGICNAGSEWFVAINRFSPQGMVIVRAPLTGSASVVDSSQDVALHSRYQRNPGESGLPFLTFHPQGGLAYTWAFLDEDGLPMSYHTWVYNPSTQITTVLAGTTTNRPEALTWVNGRWQALSQNHQPMIAFDQRWIADPATRSIVRDVPSRSGHVAYLGWDGMWWDLGNGDIRPNHIRFSNLGGDVEEVLRGGDGPCLILPIGRMVYDGAYMDLSYPVGWTEDTSTWSALSGAVVGSGPLAIWIGVPASVTYDPPAGTRLPVGVTTVRAVVTPQDATLPRLETVFQPRIGWRSVEVQVPDVTVMYGDPVPTPTLVAGGDGLAPQDTWASLATPPVLTMPTQRDAGSYAITWGSLPQDPSYVFRGAASDSTPATLTILPATAGVSVSGLSVVANGQRRPVQVSTVPAGLPVQITYNGQTQAPSAPGTYAVVATVSHRNYHGRAEEVLVIAANTPPKVSAGPFQRIPVGSTAPLQATITDPESGSGLEQTWSVTGGPVTGPLPVPSFTPVRDGIYTVTLRVSDPPVSRSATTLVYADLPGQVTVDAGLPGFSRSASGWRSVGGLGVGGTPVLESQSLQASASWQASLPAGTWHQIDVYVAPGAGLSATVPVTVAHAAGASATTVSWASGPAGWRNLGWYRSGGVLRVTVSGGTGPVRADAVRFTAIPGRIVDHGLAGYGEGGTWVTAATPRGVGASPTRRAGGAAATAAWSLAQGQGGRLLLGRVVAPDNAASWDVAVSASGAPTRRFSIEPRTGLGGWVDLGAVASGTGGVRAVLSRMGGGFLRGDAAWLAEPVIGDGWPEWRGLSGSWSPVSDGLPGLTAWTSPTAGAKAQWRVALPEGTYQVQWYRVVSPQHAPSAVIQVAHAGGVLGSTRPLTTGSTGWVTLGTVRISSGVGQVTITGQGTGRLRADAVRFQPVGDTTPVTAVPGGGG